MTTTFMNQLETFCAPIMFTLRRLDNKDRYCTDPPDQDDILDIIEAIHKDDKTEALFTEAFNACRPILMMAIHMLAFNCLLHNPKAFAAQSVKNAATDSLCTNPTKQVVNQYLIDAILQKRRNVQRSDNLWDRSLYNTDSDTPPRQRDSTRRHRLDQDEDDESTSGTSASSNTSRRRVSSLPDFAKPPPRTDNSPAAKCLKLDSRRVSPFWSSGGNSDEEAELTQLYAPSSSDRRSHTLEGRMAARILDTSFYNDDDQQHQEGCRAKNKRPLVGPPTAKNKVHPQVPSDSELDSDQGKNNPPSNPKSKSKLSAKTDQKKQL